MRSSTVDLAVLAALACSPAAAGNKCTGADGRVVFQDAPCAGKGEIIDVKPASGNAPVSASSARPAPASALPTEAQRLETVISASQQSRRARDLRERLLPAAEEARVGHRASCEQKQKDLAAQQYAYKQNLYGKTHAAQIASEMAASAATCDTKDRELRESVDELAKECAALKCRS